MPNSILHKRSSTAGVVPHAVLLANGEIALNSADGTWFIKKTDGTVLDLRQPLITDGGLALNPDAQDWAARVATAGGTVSTATLQAVNTFCNAINAAGIRDRFYRLNLFCGDNLAACLVPLYRGQSLGGTQFGNVTDTNVNFAAGDYSERGATGGLSGNGSNKYLNTGFLGNTLATGNRHLAVYESLRDTTTFKTFIGVQDDGAGTYYFAISNFNPGTRVFASFQAQAVSPDGQTTGGHWIATDPANNSLVLYKNASNVASSSSTLRALPGSQPLFVFATNNSVSGAPAGFIASRLNAYSIGLGLSQQQVTAYNTAMTAFQTALLRNIAPVVSNADAQDWVNRVYAAGGTVSQSTADAVNTFCNTINSTGLRDRFYRLNLFCGNDLTACLVPLYRGQSLGDTQFGNTTDTNNNFTASDYNERGSPGGLRGNASNKYLNTGVISDLFASDATGHLAYYAPQWTPTTTLNPGHTALGTTTGTGSAILYGRGSALACGGGVAAHVGTIGTGGGTLCNEVGNDIGGGHTVISRTGSAGGQAALYRNGVLGVTSNPFTNTYVPANLPVYVFAFSFLLSGNVSVGGWSPILMRGYSFGLSMTASQVAAYNNAMQAFQTALNRAV